MIKLNSNLEEIISSHQKEIVNINNTNSIHFEKAINEKDTLINKLQNQIADLRNELSQILSKFNELKQKNSTSSSEYSSNVQTLNQQISKQIEIIESQQKDFEFRNTSIKERYDYDRTELK